MAEEKEGVKRLVEIRKMTEADLNKVIELGSSSDEMQTGTESPQFYGRETLSKWVQSSNGILLTAESDGEFAGFILTAYNPDSKDAYIHTIAAVDKFRGKGVGDQLLERTLAELEKTECNHVYCLIKPDNEPARKLFQKHGFSLGELFHYSDRMLPRSKT
ncbi:hypothetical protein A2697_05145 [Candidatus Curtissbacteria bacterium RIFCSPHIGHO2_01_FULL_41_44]|uniref:N-acetyltransferase domain-containing protein n=1 Tax=Candidatus Curtissbacteria bacterium RIFCSPLOWO2_01_FULL_42_50 TaxID=1797730 RepID=A0A1F5H3B9_9BACT|nr:MAG: hypothetical protein A2697_05145 [Candidatus Curtissbacteria bacterium RIFCSPHIGHO2_01_FULL_41_44]OGD93111.1 MAG: hypothetical protein A3C33_04890 [Candidatus Curtissbacteria bacterium RIFCSPHIGHO2_02_FULL_42_58]OGD96773.1 MAG: hypothetical protein A3E71_01335 [Candidatus Curtissbacteria bacterium RIFCSPHIGHO2_12_FULL_42_33]OGD98633.1 MAG: hypothetical protein A3B54_02620 [Candidatus Curtissbacteria bacterium RIFCSPLOWO2_01_FULL_42_50]OGE02606.1 MAG: hypothetical protein A3G16_03730 [Ca